MGNRNHELKSFYLQLEHFFKDMVVISAVHQIFLVSVFWACCTIVLEVRYGLVSCFRSVKCAGMVCNLPLSLLW